jgi:peptidoglycan/LPS O-acetylase OafA/YrhL
MERLSRLDGLRGILAVYVMVGHALPFSAVPQWIASLSITAKRRSIYFLL